MAVTTLAALKAKFITGYQPSQGDYEDLFDTLQSASSKTLTTSLTINNFLTTDIFEIIPAPGIDKMIALEHVFIDLVTELPYSEVGDTTLSFDFANRSLGNIPVVTEFSDQRLFDLLKVLPAFTGYINSHLNDTPFTMKFADARTNGVLKINIYTTYKIFDMQPDPLGGAT